MTNWSSPIFVVKIGKCSSTRHGHPWRVYLPVCCTRPAEGANFNFTPDDDEYVVTLTDNVDLQLLDGNGYQLAEILKFFKRKALQPAYIDYNEPSAASITGNFKKDVTRTNLPYCEAPTQAVSMIDVQLKWWLEEKNIIISTEESLRVGLHVFQRSASHSNRADQVVVAILDDATGSVEFRPKRKRFKWAGGSIPAR